jgi:hypothetical protein
MGNKASARQGLDKNTMDFLVKNTNFTKDMIKVAHSFIAASAGVVHCTALHCTALHCTALHCTALQQ